MFLLGREGGVIRVEEGENGGYILGMHQINNQKLSVICFGHLFCWDASAGIKLSCGDTTPDD